MRRKIPYLHILCHSLSKNSHGKLLCDMEQLQRPALHDVAIGLPQKCRTMGWLRRCHAALPRSGFVQCGAMSSERRFSAGFGIAALHIIPMEEPRRLGGRTVAAAVGQRDQTRV